MLGVLVEHSRVEAALVLGIDEWLKAELTVDEQAVNVVKFAQKLPMPDVALSCVRGHQVSKLLLLLTLCSGQPV